MALAERDRGRARRSTAAALASSRIVEGITVLLIGDQQALQDGGGRAHRGGVMGMRPYRLRHPSPAAGGLRRDSRARAVRRAQQMREVRIIAIEGMPEVRPGDDLASLHSRCCGAAGTAFEDGDVVVITQKVVSKAEGRIVDLETVEPGAFALQIAERWEKDAASVELVLGESARIVRMDHGVMICETKHGFICANAGVDSSNVERLGTVALLPVDSDASAEAVRRRVREATGASVAVIVTDTFGRPWREGHVNFAIGVAGMSPIWTTTWASVDPAGYELRVTRMAVADEMAAAAELAHGKLDRVPVAVVRGYAYPAGRGFVARAAAGRGEGLV